MSRQHHQSMVLKHDSLKLSSEDASMLAFSDNENSQKQNTVCTESASMKNNQSYKYFEKLQLRQILKELKQRGKIQRKKLLQLIDICQNILKYQPNVLRLVSPLTVVGDIHGQFFDLINIFEQNGYPEDKKFLFLGDYVDRGLFCIEVITLLLVLKLKYPKNVLLLRGNHQGRVMTTNFNFRLECQKKYGALIYERFLQLFCKLPLCAVIDRTYFAVHGGISRQAAQIKQLQKISRFEDIQNKGVICDLVWSDPSDSSTIQWQPNGMRGCSYYYSKIQARRFLKDNKLKMIIRGHEVQIEGYSYQKTSMDEKLTLTIFSAPNYCDTYKNKGAVAIVHNNKISIQRFNEVAHPFVLSNYMDCLEFSIPGVCQLVGKILLFLLKNKHKQRKSSMIEDKTLEQLDALRRIQIMNQIFQKRILQNQVLLLQNIQKKQQQIIVTSYLAKSYQIAYQIFIKKKQNDQEEKYPDEKVLTNIREKRMMKGLKSLQKRSAQQQNGLNSEQQFHDVFGPKLQMKNNIKKKIFLLEQNQLQMKYYEQFE